MHNKIRFTVVLLLLFVASASSAATRDEAAAAVTARYRITTLGFFGDFKTIGNVLTPRREGLRANRPSKVFKPNVVKNQQLAVAGGGDLSLNGVHDGSLKPGERLYLYGVSTGDDYVLLDLHTVTNYVLTGLKGATPLQASIRFQYDGGLAEVTTRQLLNDIGEWLDAEGEFRTATGESRPPVAGRATSTVRLGQTQEEVTATLGPPEKQILLGTKTIFIYRDVKVVFVNGKLSDAE